MAKPTVSVIIPLYNRYDLTRECIQSIFSMTSFSPFEVIAVDNGSTDGTKEVLEFFSASFPNFKYIINQQNMGFAKACNQGADNAKGHYLLFLNNDTRIIQRDWMQHLLEIFTSDNRVGCVGAKLIFPNGTIEHAGLLLKKIITPEGIVLMDGQLRLFGAPAVHPEANIPMMLAAVSGACLMTPKELFMRVGGFDEAFWNGCEDVDYCLKVLAMGYKIVYQPRSVVIHLKSQSGHERFRRANENMLLLGKRWNHLPADIEIYYKMTNVKTYEKETRGNASIPAERSKSIPSDNR